MGGDGEGRQVLGRRGREEKEGKEVGKTGRGEEGRTGGESYKVGR